MLYDSIKSICAHAPGAKILIGNASTDGDKKDTSTVLKMFPNVTEVIFDPDPGFAIAYSVLYKQVKTHYAVLWTDDVFLLRPVDELVSKLEAGDLKLVALPMIDKINYDDMTWPVDNFGCAFWSTATGRCAHYSITKVDFFKVIGDVCGDGSSMTDVCDNFFHKHTNISQRFWPKDGAYVEHCRYADRTRINSILKVGNYRLTLDERTKYNRKLSVNIQDDVPVSAEDVDKRSLVDLLQSKAPLILDIGCYDGSDSAEFLQLIPEGRIHAFDGDQRSQRLFLERRSTLERLKINLETLAISNVNGMVPWFSSDSQSRRHYEDQTFWSASSTLQPPKDCSKVFPDIIFTMDHLVRSMRLDDWCKERKIQGLIDLIWADVNGAEVSLILGAGESLRRTRYLYTEFSKTPSGQLFLGAPSIDELLDILPGFEIIGIYSFMGNYGNVLLKNLKL